MASEAYETHLNHPQNRGIEPPDAFTGAAGGAACGDLIRFSLSVDGGDVTHAGFDAHGCGAVIAAGSAATELIAGKNILDAARMSADDIATELGGLIPSKQHAAELTADALHRALGAAAAARADLPGVANRTVVAMSGGVDSAVAALLTANNGGDPVAVTLELWADSANDAEGSCCSAAAVRGARALAQRMGLPHFTLDLREDFRAHVVQPYLDDHEAGLTPNPCVRCNGHVRLDAMLDLAGRLGASEGLATGHYARVTTDGDGPLLRAAADPAKDQTYMLAACEPATLARLRFPLGELTKPDVRAIAKEADLPVANRPDSQDLCFLAGTDRDSFLSRHAPNHRAREGEIVDRSGRVLGRHRGQHAFTVGQRRGLGVTSSEPLYVLEKDARTGRVVAGTRDELDQHEVAVRGAVLHRDAARVDGVKLRYRTGALPCRAVEHESRGGRLDLDLAEPIDGAAPGQVACLMEGDTVLGWATIA